MLIFTVPVDSSRASENVVMLITSCLTANEIVALLFRNTFSIEMIFVCRVVMESFTESLCMTAVLLLMSLIRL